MTTSNLAAPSPWRAYARIAEALREHQLLEAEAAMTESLPEPGVGYTPANWQMLEAELVATFSADELSLTGCFEPDADGNLRFVVGLRTPGEPVLMLRPFEACDPLIATRGMTVPDCWVARSMLTDLETRRRREAFGGAVIAVDNVQQAVAWRQRGLAAIVVAGDSQSQDMLSFFWRGVDSVQPAGSRAFKKLERAFDNISWFQKTRSETSQRPVKRNSPLHTLLVAPTFDPTTCQPAVEPARVMAERLVSWTSSSIQHARSIAVWSPPDSWLATVREMNSGPLPGPIVRRSLKHDVMTVDWLLDGPRIDLGPAPVDLVAMRRRLESCTERTPVAERRAARAAYREQLQDSLLVQPPTGRPADLLEALRATLTQQFAAVDAELALATNDVDPRERENAVNQLHKITQSLLHIDRAQKGGRYGTRRRR